MVALKRDYTVLVDKLNCNCALKIFKERKDGKKESDEARNKVIGRNVYP